MQAGMHAGVKLHAHGTIEGSIQHINGTTLCYSIARFRAVDALEK